MNIGTVNQMGWELFSIMTLASSNSSLRRCWTKELRTRQISRLTKKNSMKKTFSEEPILYLRIMKTKLRFKLALHHDKNHQWLKRLYRLDRAFPSSQSAKTRKKMSSATTAASSRPRSFATLNCSTTVAVKPNPSWIQWNILRLIRIWKPLIPKRRWGGIHMTTNKSPRLPRSRRPPMINMKIPIYWQFLLRKNSRRTKIYSRKRRVTASITMCKRFNKSYKKEKP